MRHRGSTRDPSQRHGRSLAPLTLAVAAVTCTATIAACGSSTHPTAPGASHSTSRLAFARGAAVPGRTQHPSRGDPVRQRSKQPRPPASSCCPAAVRAGESPKARGSACWRTPGACAGMAFPTTPTRHSPAAARLGVDPQLASTQTPRRTSKRQPPAEAREDSTRPPVGRSNSATPATASSGASPRPVAVIEQEAMPR
jgi:hypothetical protein